MFHRKLDEQSEQKNQPRNTAQNRNDTVQNNQIQPSSNNNSVENIKEEKTMNNPEQNKMQTPEGNATPQARVDIPGNNFQRPGAPAAPAQPQAGARPAYPGSYPGAAQANAPMQSSANQPMGTAQTADDRQLIIGKGITMSGEIESCDTLIVEGAVEAALKGASTLEIAESGMFFGTVEIEEATIAGRFEGDITVNGRLNVESTGIIIGTISYKELSIEAGATIDGTLRPVGSEVTASQRPAKKASPKSRKVSANSGAELPFADKNAA